MTKKASETGGKDRGLTIRVPLEILKKLREKAAEVPRGPLQSEKEVLVALAQRALEIGAASPKLVPRE